MHFQEIIVSGRGRIVVGTEIAVFVQFLLQKACVRLVGMVNILYKRTTRLAQIKIWTGGALIVETDIIMSRKYCNFSIL
jgi:hypothetical protein